MNKKRKAGYARQRKLHEHMRDYPSRSVHQLAQAIERQGWKVVGWEYEVQEDEWCAWYDCAVRVWGKLCFIDIVGGGTSGLSKRERAILAKKEDYCKRHDIPYLQLPPASVMVQQGKLAMWATRLGRLQ